MSRLTPETLKLWREKAFGTWMNSALGEYTPKEFLVLLDAYEELARERDEAIVGAYRAAADEVTRFGDGYFMDSPSKSSVETGEALHSAAREILALTPQSVLDAVERDRREIAKLAFSSGYDQACYDENPVNAKAPECSTADDVLAKVKRA